MSGVGARLWFTDRIKIRNITVLGPNITDCARDTSRAIHSDKTYNSISGTGPVDLN